MGLTLKVIHFDDDVVGIRARCDSGRFAGTAECYAGHTAFGDLAASMRGFPATDKDRRQHQIGTMDSTHAGGGVRLELRCADRSGHAVADVSIRSESWGRPLSGEERAEFSFPVEPAAVDDFVRQLEKAKIEMGATVELREAT